MFYLFFPIACLLLARRKLLIPLLCGFVLLGPFARTMFTHGNDIWQEKSYLGSMDAIALGCLAAMLSSRVTLSQQTRRIVGSLGITLMLFMLCFSRTAYRWGLGDLGLEMTVLAIGTSLVIIASTQSEWKGPRFLTPLLDLGQRSYEVYLTHMFVVMGLFDVFVRLGKPM